MRIIYFILSALLIASCGGEKPAENASGLDAKLEELQKLKTEQVALATKISTLEKEIVVIDPSRAIKPKLVTIAELTPEGFQHYINLQGSVSSENISYVAPRNGMGGYVKALYVKEGQNVKKGQLLLKLDDQVLRQSIEALRTQLSFAQNIYERNKTLWDQKIGSEVQLLSSKNNVESLENQIKIQEEQLKTFLVYADQSGIADIVNIRQGELFTGVTVAGPQIQIVNNSALSVKADVPENYANKVKQGGKVVVEIPSIGKTFNSTIAKLSQSINAGTRGFTAECKIPTIKELKPNMSAMIKVLSHSNSKAIVIPINIVQNDDKGKYVYIMKDIAGKKVAHKLTIKIGDLYGEDVEVLSGLTVGDKLITQGYQNLYEGQLIQN